MILSYVVSITWYIIQPLVRLLLCITSPQLVWYYLHRFVLCNNPIQFLLRMFSLQSEYISPYSVSTLPLNRTTIVRSWTWIVPPLRLARTSWTDQLGYQCQQHGKVLWPYFRTVPEWSDVEYLYVWFDVQLLDLPWGISQLGCLSILELVRGWDTLFLCWRIWAMQLVIQCWLIPYIQLLPLTMRRSSVTEMPKILCRLPSGKCDLMLSDDHLCSHPNLSLSIRSTHHPNSHHIWFWVLLCLWGNEVCILHT